VWSVGGGRREDGRTGREEELDHLSQRQEGTSSGRPAAKVKVKERTNKLGLCTGYLTGHTSASKALGWVGGSISEASQTSEGREHRGSD